MVDSNDLFGDAGKNLRVLGGELGENFAVELDAGLFQLIDEGAVGFVAVLAECGVEPDDPELAEIGLLVAPVGEGVSARAHERFMRVALLLRADAAVALGSFQNILAALLRHHSSFDSCHTKMITTLIKRPAGNGGELSRSD